jgi:catechol 2,3-dioxygenase-like lactoylglutathione lyase family enzyme
MAASRRWALAGNAAVAALILAPLPAAAEEGPVVTTVSHVGITVSDINRAVALFRNVLGGTATEPRAFPGSSSDITGVPHADIIISIATLAERRFELVQYVRPKGASSRLRPPNPGHVHIALGVSDLPAMVDRLRAAGFTGSVPNKYPDGRPRPVYLYGFDGLTFELFARP